jgi:hypothetical protein
MIFRIPLAVALAFAMLSFACEPAAAQTPRFSAQFASGKRLDGAEIFDWQDEKADPRLDNQKLFYAADRLSWIEDNALAPAETPEAFVEFFGGDRLPGRVLEYRTGQESLYRKSPACLVVAPGAGVDWPESKRQGGLPVVTRWLRRVVWQAREDDRYRPGTLFYLNGRQIEFRGLRWSKNSVRVLLESETRDVTFDQIAELHLPRPAPWEAWFDQLAAVLPDGAGLVLQVETGDGVRATASTVRFSAAAHGDAGKPDNWYHAVQPAWSLEPLWLRHRAIRVRRYFLPHEIPLSAIEPTRAVQKSNLAGGWSWELDRNVQGWPMRCGDHPFGWGFGVHAYSELGFDLPGGARTFRTQYGLDRAAGAGGCVRAAVFAGPATGAPLFRSDHVIGSAKSHDTGPLSVSGAKQLTLVVDPASHDRPAGADPFEIRDMFDWLQPVIEFDSESLKAGLERRHQTALWGWAGWNIVNAKSGPFVVSTSWDQQRPPARRCRVEVAPKEAFLAITRRLEIGERHRFLVVSVNRLEKDSGPSRIQVRLDGKAAAEFEVPIRNAASDPDPLLVPVDRFCGKTIDVALVQMALTPQARVEWRGIDLAERDPVVFEAFEDSPEFAGELADGNGTIKVDLSEKFTGTASLRVTPDDKNNPRIADWNVPIRSDPNPGEYRFIRFAWKKHGGKEIGLHLAQNGAFTAPLLINPKETYRYHVGRGVKNDYGVSVQFRDKPPDQWELVTRDLFADFGPFDASGVRLVCGDREWAAFDHIYFARRVEDLDRTTRKRQQPAPDPTAVLPVELKATVERVATEPARYGEALGEVAPKFSTAASENGVLFFKTWQGRKNVVRTHPPEQGKPCILRAPLSLPADKHAELKLAVSHHPQADWQLLVFANGEKLHESMVAENTTQAGWADVSVDLSRFAGHNVVLEVHNHPNNWANEFAYWGTVEVVQ